MLAATIFNTPLAASLAATILNAPLAASLAATILNAAQKITCVVECQTFVTGFFLPQ